jgi:hypothetical protein
MDKKESRMCEEFEFKEGRGEMVTWITFWNLGSPCTTAD